MAEETNTLSDGQSAFETTVKDQKYEWRMGLVLTIRRYEEAVEAAKGNGQGHFDALDVVIDAVVEAGGPPLNLDQADEFVDLLYQQLAIKKKARGSVFASLQKSPNSMPSILRAGTRNGS